MTLIINLPQLREALRVAQTIDQQLPDGDSLQIHLDEAEESVLKVTLWSNTYGQPAVVYTIDPAQSPGETGRAQEAPLSDAT